MIRFSLEVAGSCARAGGATGAANKRAPAAKWAQQAAQVELVRPPTSHIGPDKAEGARFLLAPLQTESSSAKGERKLREPLLFSCQNTGPRGRRERKQQGQLKLT